MTKKQLDRFNKVLRRLGELRKKGLKSKEIDKILTKEFGDKQIKTLDDNIDDIDIIGEGENVR